MMEDTHFRPTRRRKRRVQRFLVAFGVALLLFVIATPYVAQSPPVLGWIVTAVAQRQNVHASVGEASFGWFSPLELRDVAIETPYGEPLLDVERIRADRPWWQLGVAGQRLGTFTIDQPAVTLVASPGGWNSQGIGPPPPADSAQGSAPRARRQPELTADVHGAALTLYRTGVSEPLIDVRGVNVTAHIRYNNDVRWLTVEPFQPLDRKRLTPEMCENGLQLAAPILANATWTEGSVSLSIDEFRLPLDPRSVPPDGHPAAISTPAAHASGRLELHSVETGLKNPLLKQIADKVAALLGTQMPTRIRVADDSLVQFQLRDRRVYHEGLAFGLPEISPTLVIQTSGSVGLDKTLDLQVQIPVVLDLALSGPLAQRISGKSIHLAVTGTLDDPKVSLPPEETAWQQLTRLLGDNPDEADGVVADDIAGLAKEILPGARETAANVVQGIAGTLSQIRDRRAERRAARDSSSDRSNADAYDESAVAGSPGDPSGDALPPAPPVEPDGRARADQDEDAADERPSRGPLRRLLDRRRERRAS
jgi:hypothetical protein